MKVWTIEDIHRMSEFGGQTGWFYGLVKEIETEKVRLREVFPGLGYTEPWPMWHPKSWWWVVRDVWRS